MTYAEMKQTFDDAKASARKLNMLTLRAQQSTQVAQRLTAMYGAERVQSSASNENPALMSIIRFEEWADEMRDELEDAVQKVQSAKALLVRMPKSKSRDLLVNFFLLDWNYTKIMRLEKWRSKTSVKRALVKALSELHSICK